MLYAHAHSLVFVWLFVLYIISLYFALLLCGYFFYDWYNTHTDAKRIVVKTIFRNSIICFLRFLLYLRSSIFHDHFVCKMGTDFFFNWQINQVQTCLVKLKLIIKTTINCEIIWFKAKKSNNNNNIQMALWCTVNNVGDMLQCNNELLLLSVCSNRTLQISIRYSVRFTTLNNHICVW